MGDVTIMAHSLGCAVAIQTLAQLIEEDPKITKCVKLILLNGFTNCVQADQHMMPWLPSWLARLLVSSSHEWDSIATIQRLRNMDILFISCTGDEQIPKEHMWKLYRPLIPKRHYNKRSYPQGMQVHRAHLETGKHTFVPVEGDHFAYRYVEVSDRVESSFSDKKLSAALTKCLV